MSAARFKVRKPVDPHVLMLDVLGREQVSPNMMRVSFGGDGLNRFTYQGFDQWFRLFLPRPGQETLKLPTRTSALWYAQYLATPRAKRPYVRCYTVRNADPYRLDVDFVMHTEPDGSCGPAADFARNAVPGQRVGLLDQGVGYHPRHEHDWTLLVADETGLPAVAGICRSLPAGARGLALVEIPSAADAQDFPVPDGVTLRWIARDGHGVPAAWRWTCCASRCCRTVPATPTWSASPHWPPAGAGTWSRTAVCPRPTSTSSATGGRGTPPGEDCAKARAPRAFVDVWCGQERVIAAVFFDEPSITWPPVLISMRRGLAVSATGMVSVSTPSCQVAAMRSRSRPSPSERRRSNVPVARSRRSHWTSASVRGDRSARIVSTRPSTSTCTEPGSMPARSQCRTKWSPERYRSIGIAIAVPPPNI
ncbi:NADPH-dependent ferric siderophore reductase [Catenuloplanes niger]|uniref:NADPH-dependent ferric siderophore reductase n=1 Tax=Catenuloplanes niger TaxID=587534 RepID=A0AAE4CR35_9ACTN|nr:NADPH-dependent ferric siderophore reductase [Catenuloplanes niger]